MGSTMKIRNVLRCAAEQTTTIDDIYGWPEADHNKPNGYIYRGMVRQTGRPDKTTVIVIIVGSSLRLRLSKLS